MFCFEVWIGMMWSAVWMTSKGSSTSSLDPQLLLMQLIKSVQAKGRKLLVRTYIWVNDMNISDLLMCVQFYELLSKHRLSVLEFISLPSTITFIEPKTYLGCTCFVSNIIPPCVTSNIMYVNYSQIIPLSLTYHFPLHYHLTKNRFLINSSFV